MSDALRNETPLEGEDRGWVLIGGLKLDTTIAIRSEDGQPLLDLTLKARPGITQDFDPNGIFTVLLKRGEDGGIERLTVNFTSQMEYSNQTPVPEAELLQKFVKLGLMKRK